MRAQAKAKIQVHIERLDRGPDALTMRAQTKGQIYIVSQ